MSNNYTLFERLTKKFDHKRSEDKEYVLKMVEKDVRYLQFASDKVGNDKEFLLMIVKEINYFAIEYSTEEIRNDRDIVLEAVKQNGRILEFASEVLRNDEVIVLEAVKENVDAFQYASEELRNDEDIVLEVMRNDTPSLQYFSEELRNEKEIVLEAVKKNGSDLKYASEELRSDKEIVHEAVKQCGLSLEYASEELRNDKNIVVEALKNNTFGEGLHYIDRSLMSILRFASEELRNDKEVVLEAMKNKESLLYASEELRNDKEIVLEAVKITGLALQYANEEILTDKDIVLEAMKNHGSFALRYVKTEEIQNDREIILEAVKDNGSSLQFASKELRNDREIVLEGVKRSGRSLEFSSRLLQNDKEIVLEAVTQNGHSLKYASERLQNDKDILLEAVKENGFAIEYAGEIPRNDKVIVIEAVKRYGNLLKYASERLRTDREVVIEAVKNIGSALQYAGEELRNDKNFIQYLVHHVNPKIFEDGSHVRFIGEKLLQEEEFLKEIFPQNTSISSEVFSKITFPFFSEDVNEEEEELQLNRISNQMNSILESRKVLDAFPPSDDRDYFFTTIGSGCFGVSYRVKFNGYEPIENFRRRFGEERVSYTERKLLLETLKTQYSGSDFEGDFSFFVLKVYNKPEMTEEKREKLIEKDRLSIPYHKNTATILFHRSDEVMNIRKFCKLSDEEYWREKLPSGVYEFRTGVLIMKYYKQDLEKYVKKRILSKLPSISKLEICRILQGIIHGVCHLHSNFIVHRDLHPENIFINEMYGRVWVGDFGCCLDLRANESFLVQKDEEVMYSTGRFSSESSCRSMDIGGYLKYLAPEIVNFDGEKEVFLNYSKADLYSVGILSLFLIYSAEDNNIVKKVGEEDYDLIFHTTSCDVTQYEFFERIEKKVFVKKIE